MSNTAFPTSKPRTHQGFTLLEMTVVVFLIGLIASFAVVNIGDTNSKKTLHEARRFAALVNHALDEAILLGRPIGIEVDEGQKIYRFQMYDDGWTAVESDELLRPRQLPENMRIQFTLLEYQRPVRADNQQASKYTAARVHEILNDSLFDDDEGSAIDELFERASMIVVEPTGLLPPFTFEIADKNKSFSVTLDDYGRAVVDTGEQG